MYYVVSRLRDKQGDLERFPFAITDSKELVSQINYLYEIPMRNWIQENIESINNGFFSIEEYFKIVTDCFEISWETENIDNIKLPIIREL